MRQPFFIVGAGRSGTTRMFSLLERHRKIALTSEAYVADFLYYCTQWADVPKYESRTFMLPPYNNEVRLDGIVLAPYQDTFRRVFRRHAVAALEDFYREQFADREFTHWGDKLTTPEVAAELQSLYPNVKYVVLVRDPRSWCASLVRWRERDALPIAPLLREQRPSDWALFWQNTYTALVRYLRDHVVLRYEDFVDDPLRTLTECLDFLGLDGAAEILGQAEKRDTFTGHATSASPEDSLHRWRRDLSADDVRAIEEIAAEGMQRFGYA